MPQPVLSSQWSHSTQHIGSGSLSPTDVDARGQYEYQEPEVDEQGTYYGYKILNRHCQTCYELVSPSYYAEWHNGEVTAEGYVHERSMYGIHCTKRPDHPELKKHLHKFFGCYYYSSVNPYQEESSVLVKCALSGTIVETEQGFRAEHAQIIGVFDNGDWKSYSDYQERSRPNPRTITREEWDEENGWRVRYTTYPKGACNTYFDPSADS